MSTKITRAMMDSLDYNDQSEIVSKKSAVTKRSIFFIFNGSDLDAAAYYISKSYKDPESYGSVPIIYVQESCENEFIGKLKSKTLSSHNSSDADNNLSKSYNEVNANLENLNARTVKLNSGSIAPILVYQFNPEYFQTSEDCPLISCIEVFRTVKEVISISKTAKHFENASIWNENHSMAYEIVVNTSFRNFFINCFNVSLQPLADNLQACAIIEKSFHFECFSVGGNTKNVVFPIGTTFAN